MSNRRLLLTAGWGLVLAAVAAGLVAGLESRALQSARASPRTGTWRERWRSDADPEPLPMRGRELPPQVPGPLDAWAGHRSHTFRMRFDQAPGWYRLQLLLYEAHDAAPPSIDVSLNGRTLRPLRIRKGHGRGGPYETVDAALTSTRVLHITAPSNTLSFTTRTGSWIAPAELRLVPLRPRFNAAKAGYLLLADPRLLYGLLGSALAGCGALAAARVGPRRAVAQLVLACFSIALSLACAEALFRQYLLRHPRQRVVASGRAEDPGAADQRPTYTYATMIEPDNHPQIPYRLRPRLDGRFGDQLLRTNGDRMRGPEVRPAKTPGTLRVLGLGDSVMFGWGVAYEEAALTLLGRRLEDALGMPVETLNTGCPSYDTAVEVAVLKEYGLRYDPDLVVLIFLHNDLGFPGAMIEPVRPWTLRRSYLREQARRRLADRWGNAPAEGEDFISTRSVDRLQKSGDVATNDQDRLVLQVRDHYARMVGRDAVRERLADLQETLAARGIPGLLLYNPIALTPGRPESYEPTGAWVVGEARALGLLAEDMSPSYDRYLQDHGFTNMAAGLWVSPDDWHPRAPAHALMAERAFDALREHGVLEQLRARAARSAP